MATYFVIQADNDKALSAPPLTAADFNPLDRSQHFSLLPGKEGVYIVSRIDGRVLDITGSKFVKGTVLGVWQKKDIHTNQRFNVNFPSTITVLGATKLNVVVSATNKIVLDDKPQVWKTLPVPNEHEIIFHNTGSQVITITYDNAPQSEPTKSWTLIGGSQVPVTFFEGAILTAKDETGKVRSPSPYTVSKKDTIFFADELPPIEDEEEVPPKEEEEVIPPKEEEQPPKEEDEPPKEEEEPPKEEEETTPPPKEYEKDIDRAIATLIEKISALEQVVDRRFVRQTKWIRVNADQSILKGEGLKPGRVTPSDTFWTILFNTPREDTNYTVVANVHHPEFWRTWPRITNLTTTGFDVHFLTENRTAIRSDVNKNVAGAHPMEISCVVEDDAI